MARTDPHSYFDDSQPRATRWLLRLLVDFDSRILGGRGDADVPPAGGRRHPGPGHQGPGHPPGLDTR